MPTPVSADPAAPARRRSSARRSLIWSSSAVAIAAVLGMQLLTTYLVRKDVLASAAELEAHEARADAVRLSSAFSGLTRSLARITGDYANWTDTYAYVANPSQAYFDENLNPNGLYDLGVEALLVTDASGATVTTGSVLAPDQPMRPADRRLADALRRAAESAHDRPDHRAGGIVQVEGKSYIVAAQAITPTNQLESVNGWLAFASPIDGSTLQVMEAELGVRVHLGPQTGLQLRTGLPTPEDTLITDAPLVSPGGSPPVLATIERPRRATARARQTAFNVGVITLATAALVLSAVLLGLRRAVHRIGTLADAARDAGQGPTSGRRVVVTGSDEVAALGHVFNEMLAERDAAGQLAAGRERLLTAGTMAAGLAHELNNPLAYVIGNLSYLAAELESAQLSADAEQALADATTGADRIAAIVKDLQLFSGQQPERATVNVREVVEGSARLMRSRIQGRARLVVETTDAFAVATESALGQIVINLLQNALQALPDRDPEQTQITVRCYENGGKTVLEVEDNGTGIAPEVLPRIFEPFFTTRPPGVGTGLGLSVCHGIVAGFGGALTVRTELGVGTTFTVTLPRAPKPKSARTERPRVLLMDDDPMARAALARWLRDKCDLVEAADGAAAQRAWREQRFDVGLFDVMMPGISGVELYNRICAEDPTAASRIGFVTGGAVSPEGQMFLREHPDRILRKPYSGAELHRFLDGLRGE